MAFLLIAAVMLQAPANQVRLYCEVPLRRITVDREPWRLTMTLDVEGDRIASAVLDGPPLFSSYRPIRVRRGAEEAAAAVEPRLLPRGMQWRAHFQGRALRLRREGTDMVLEPAARAAGTYSGFWRHLVAVGPPPVEVNGTIQCRTIAGTLSESARS